jgi:hypothetical protein
MALDPLGREPDLLIERDRARIILAHRQLHAHQAAGARGIKCSRDQPTPDALSAIRRQNTHAEHADMPMDRKPLRRRIAPADHLAVRQRREPRMALADVVLHKAPRVFERRRFQHDEIAPLARNGVERPVEAIDMGSDDRRDFDHIISVMCAILPLADRPRNNYVGASPPTTD